jgi:hypothetical protein
LQRQKDQDEHNLSPGSSLRKNNKMQVVHSHSFLFHMASIPQEGPQTRLALHSDPQECTSVPFEIEYFT